MAKILLTKEVNAAIEGFFRGGVDDIVVADGHGHGGLDPSTIDRRAQLQRGWPPGPYPLGLNSSFDACAWIGQHAKSGTNQAHLAHTQSFNYLDLSVNELSIGEFGQLAFCALEIDVYPIFGSGGQAFTKEAKELVPDIRTVSVKRGLGENKGDSLSSEEYAKLNTAAIHLSPEKARESIREGAYNAVKDFRSNKHDIVGLNPPFERVALFRATEDKPQMISRESHDTSFIDLMNMAYNPKPVSG